MTRRQAPDGPSLFRPPTWGRTRRPMLAALSVSGLALALAPACSVVEAEPTVGSVPREAAASEQLSASDPGRTNSPEPPNRSLAPSPSTTSAATPKRSPGVREPRRSYLSIPALGLRRVPVVRYPGRPDDAQGTRIQDRGPTASPRGPGGGVGPGEVGNFIVTGHRTSHSAPFRDLPGLKPGDRVVVRSGRTEFVYRITATRRTSFRSAKSRAEQTAAVPGRPDVPPEHAMVTLSTCATPEDHAAGNYWSDRFGNPEHRIDKVGVLVRTRTPG